MIPMSHWFTGMEDEIVSPVYVRISFVHILVDECICLAHNLNRKSAIVDSSNLDCADQSIVE